jgi:hypothetical protein
MMNFMLWIEGVENRGPQGTPKRGRGPREDIYEVMEAGMHHGVIVGPMWEYVARLHGGAAMNQPSEAERVKKLAGQISGFGGYWERPIVDEENVVMEGQHRLEAARHLGYKKIPIMRVMDLGRVFGYEQMAAAAKAVKPMGGDALQQIVGRALDTLYEEKGNVEEALQYTVGRGYDDAFHAAINAAKRAKLPNYIKA